MRERAQLVGVFDSGLGGLSVLREIVTKLPGLRLAYVADSGHCPYGGKSQEEIIGRAVVITDFLLSRGAELIVVACNTATIAAVEYLRATYSVGFVGMEPAVKPAVARTRTGVVGVLATGAALSGEKLLQLIDRHGSGVRIITQPCPGLVEQVESGDLKSERTQDLIHRYTTPLVAAGADVLVLGCTHYPFLRAEIQAQVGAGITLLDTGEAVARRVSERLPGDLPVANRDCEIDWFTTGSPQRFSEVGGKLWGSTITASEMIPQSSPVEPRI